MLQPSMSGVAHTGGRWAHPALLAQGVQQWLAGVKEKPERAVLAQDATHLAEDRERDFRRMGGRWAGETGLRPVIR